MQMFIYLGAILLARVVQAVFGKRSSNNIDSIAKTAVFTSYRNTISALLGLALILPAFGRLQISSLAVWISLLSGASLMAVGFCDIYAMKSGTVGLVSIFGTAGLIIPVLAGAMFFGQSVKLPQIFGICVFFAAAWLLIGSSRSIYKNFSIKTALLLVGSMLGNGTTMLAQQLYARYVPNGSVSVFSFISFAFVAVMGIPLTFLIRRIPSEKDRPVKLNKSLLICGAALASAVFVINQFATPLTAMLPPALLFTFINGGATIISTIVAAILYHEKLSARSVFGVLLGIISMIIIKMFGG